MTWFLVTGADGELRVIKPASSYLVYCWGNGVSKPTLLPLPSTDVHVVEVAVGWTQKAAVTKTGRLVLWEVGKGAAHNGDTAVLVNE